MGFEKVIGQNHLKAHLKKSVENKRIPHAQLFVGDSGTGALPLAIAYAQEILSSSFEVGSDAHNACLKKVAALMHPDLHFVYPINTNDVVKKHPLSSNFLKDWRSFVSNNPYGTLYQWLETLGIEKKQGNINVDEAKEMMKALSLKAYDGGYKIMIVWMADRMNTACANKILKLVEEPPDKTVLLLITEQEEHILGTIKSRCQKLQFPKLSEQQIKSQLIDLKGVNEARASSISKQAQGDFNKALTLLTEDGDDIIFEKWFISWMRTAFKAKGNKSAINSLITWSEEIAGQGRETQKKFLAYCT
ncbi:MAG: DNA polymerase-3 subunit delta', partial [Patiriisocius sp.]